MLTKGGARAGDRLLLSKPLGVGVTTTALKGGAASDDDVAEAVRWMKRLNKQAAQLALASGAHAVTDVTGFSLLGHGWEMASASGVGFRLAYGSIPFISCAARFADQWLFPGGASDNAQYFGHHVRFDPELDEASRMLLFDPQTSGGLLMAVPPERVDAVLEQGSAAGQPLWVIGDVVDGDGIDVALE